MDIDDPHSTPADERKRPAQYLDPEESGRPRKQPRISQEESVEHGMESSTETKDVSNNDTTTTFSFTDRLAVPCSYIFRVPNQQHGEDQEGSRSHANPTTASVPPASASSAPPRRPILSRNEAQCFWKVGSLAMELDALIKVSSQILAQQVDLKKLRGELAHANNGYLRSLIPLVHSLGKTLPQRGLEQVSQHLQQVQEGVINWAGTLHQLSEQNWATYESLLDLQDHGDAPTATGGGGLAEEKRRLSVIQEDLAQRLELVFPSAGGAESAAYDDSKTMQQYCAELVCDTSSSSSSGAFPAVPGAETAAAEECNLAPAVPPPDAETEVVDLVTGLSETGALTQKLESDEPGCDSLSVEE